VNREEHLEWCKKHAFEYLDIGDIANALASFGSDMSKHDETKDHPVIELGMTLLRMGKLTISEARKLIGGVN
jgi:hypothetical protein